MSEFGSDDEEEGVSASGYERESLRGSLAGLEIGDLGDLSDVPHAYLREVVDLIRSLPSPEDEPGGLDQLRSWILIMSQKGGFSREATLQLLRAIAQVIEAERPKGPLGVTRESLQKAFVRVGGVKETVNVMLMRLNDAAVVAACIRVMTASVTGAPLAAEALHNDGADKLRLMLRAIERHYTTSFDVAEQGCLFISHLCAPVGTPGSSAAPVRSRAHKDSQRHLGDAGTVDLMAEILASSVLQVKDAATKTELMEKKATESAAIGPVASRGNKTVSESVMRVKANIELRQAWVRLNTLEATAGRVQDAALQALILLSFGSDEMMRMLAGTFWCWESGRQSSVKNNVVAQIMAQQAKEKRPKGVMGPLKAVMGGQMGPAKRGAIFAGDAPDDMVVMADLPEGEERCSMTTFEGFTKCCFLLLEVLKGRATRDRPHVAAKACRLIKALTEYYAVLLKQIETHRKRERVEIEATLYGAPVPEDNRQPQAPFALLGPVVSGLMYAVRLHKEDAPFLADAIAALKCIKDLALISAPAGVANYSDTMLYAWQRIMAEAEEKDELKYAEECLKKAVETTDVGNERLRMLGRSADELYGDGVWLTPRMREAVATASGLAAELEGDAMASRWSKGDPARRKRRVDALKHAEEARVQKAKSDRRGSKTRDMSARSSGSGRSSMAGTARRGSSKEASPGKKSLGFASRRGSKPGSQASGSPLGSAVSTSRTGRGTKVQPVAEEVEEKHVRDAPRGSTEIPRLMAATLQSLQEGPQKNQQSSPESLRHNKRGALQMSLKDLNKGLKKLQGPDDADEDKQKPQWNRALGYGFHDEADFDRIWRKPLQEVLERSLSMPVVGRTDGTRGTHRNAITLTHVEREGAPEADASLSDLQIELIKSEPGVMKTRIFVQPQDRFHQSASEIRLRQLLDPEFSSQMVTQNLSKNLRKNGCLLPEYGIQVVFKKSRRPPPNMTAVTTGALPSVGTSLAPSQATSRSATPSRPDSRGSKQGRKRAAA